MQQDMTKEAFGAPGIEPRWTHGNKNGIGTAYSASSKIWFTLFGGIVTEVYYPTVDRPQIRDLQYLVTDGKSFFHEEKRGMKSTVERLSSHALGFACKTRTRRIATRSAKRLSLTPFCRASCNTRG
jgi:glucoamylase